MEVAAATVACSKFKVYLFETAGHKTANTPHLLCYEQLASLPSPLCNCITLLYIVAHSVRLIHPGHSSLLFVSFTRWLNFMIHMTLMNNSDILPEQTLPSLCNCKLHNSRLTQLKKILKSHFFKCSSSFSLRNESRMRWRWRKNTPGRHPKWWGCYAVTSKVPLCWSSDFNWTAGCMRVHLTICIIILDLCKIYLRSLPPFHILQHCSVQPLFIFSLK